SLLCKQLRINRDRGGSAGLRVVKGTLVVKVSVPHEASHHRQCARGEHIVDEGFLPLQSLSCRATRKRSFAQRRIHDRGKQLGNGTQPCLGTAIEAVEGLTKDKLTI